MDWTHNIELDAQRRAAKRTEPCKDCGGDCDTIMQALRASLDAAAEQNDTIENLALKFCDTNVNEGCGYTQKALLTIEAAMYIGALWFHREQMRQELRDFRTVSIDAAKAEQVVIDLLLGGKTLDEIGREREKSGVYPYWTIMDELAYPKECFGECGRMVQTIINLTPVNSVPCCGPCAGKAIRGQ